MREFLLGEFVQESGDGTIMDWTGHPVNLETCGSSAHLRIEVEDQRIGLTEAQQGRLFKAFSQADDSTTRKYGGSSLGLAICKPLAAMMGGDVGVCSEAGVGSTFWLTVRLEHAADADPPVAGDTATGAEPGSAEPAEARRRCYPGLRVDVAEHGQHAVERLRASEYGAPDDYALVLMDMQMPVMDRLAATLLAQLETLLAEDDTRAEERWRESLASIETALGPLVNRLDDEIRRFDFDKARQTLRQARARNAG